MPNLREKNESRKLIFMRVARSEIELFLQDLYTVASDGQFGLFVVPQTNQDTASEPGVQLLHELQIDHGRTVDPKEPPRVELRFEVRDTAIDAVVFHRRRSERKLVFRVKVRHPCQVDELYPVTRAGGQPGWI